MLIIDNNLLDKIVTTKQAERFISNINNLMDQLFKTDQTWEQKMVQYLTERQLSIVQSAIERNQIPVNNPVEMERLLKKLKEAISKMDEVPIKIAVDLPYLKLKNIAKWFRKQTKIQVLLNVTVDEKLLGGVIILKGGRRKDYSLRTKLEELFTHPDFDITGLIKK